MSAAVQDLARSLTSEQLPAYVHDLTELRQHAAAVRAALPSRVELYYAAKANPEPRLLTALRDSVDGYEGSSGGELAHLRAAAPGASLAFGGPGKTPEEIAAALRGGVHRWHLESLHELRLLAAQAESTDTTVDVLLRVNLPVGSDALDSVPLAMGGRPTPFGLDPEQAVAGMRMLAGSRPGLERLRLRGVHAHPASGLDAQRQLALADQVVDWTLRTARQYGVELDEVNVGGGMSVDYTAPDTRFDWTAYGLGLAALLERHPGLTLRIEPGRALTAYCGWYATEVLDVKRSHGEDFAVLRGGTHQLRTPVARGHDQPFDVLRVADWPHPWPRPGVTGGRVTLVGQLCTPKDVLARRVAVPGLRAGDRVLFGVAGAYAWNISHQQFLMHPHPGFHYVG
jgi:diaminopimelate decarboxylase